MSNDIEYLRRALGATDPVGADVFDGAAADEEGRATLARILAAPAPPPRHRFRRRVAVVGAGLAVGVGAATAAVAGVVPSDVSSMFGGKSAIDPAMGAIPDRAHMVAESTAPSGDRVQYWVAPTTRGSECAMFRIVSPDPHQKPGWSNTECGTRPGALGAPGWSTLSIINAPGCCFHIGGHTVVPGSTRVRVTVNGASRTLRLADGYFVTTYPSLDDVESMKYRLETLDDAGHVLSNIAN